MSVPLDSLVGELYLIEGVRQSTMPATGVFTAPRRTARGRVDDTLYVLLDLTGDVSGADLHELMQRLTQTYWSMPGSVTSALRATANAAGEWLMDHNTHAPVPERKTGGIVCAVLRGSDVYIAQAGPTRVYVVQHGALQQFPAPDSEPLVPLGMSRAVDVHFAHEQLQPGDVMLMTDARFSQRVPLEALVSAIANVSVEKALQNLEHLVGKGDLIALMVQAAPVEQAVQPQPVPVPPPVPVARITESAPSKSPPPSARSTTPVEPTVDSGPIIRIAGRPGGTTSASGGGKPPPATPAQPATATPEAANKAIAGTSISAWFGALVLSLRRSVGSVGKAGQVVAQRTLPEPTAARVGQSITPRHNVVMFAIAIGIPIIIALLVASVYTQRSAQAAVESHVASAQNEIALTQSAITGGEIRRHWAAAANEARQALQLDPHNAQAAQLLEQAQAELDKIDNVIRLTPTVVWDSKSTGQQHIAGQGLSLFVLDRTANQINRLILNTAGDKLESNPDPILVPGMTVDGQTPGNLIDLTSMTSSANQQASDLVIGHEKGLLDYNLAFGLKTLPFGSNSTTPATRRMRSFNGKLYVLDPNANQLLRYEPAGDGYPNPPQPYFGKFTPALAQASDMAIDGSAYLTFSDGKVLKYTDAQTDTFNIRGVGEPLRQPTVIAVDQNVTDSSVYVVDQATSRIVQLRPDGLFVRQFRADGPAFDGIEDILIDEPNNRLYVMSQGVLYTAVLPPLH